MRSRSSIKTSLIKKINDPVDDRRVVHLSGTTAEMLLNVAGEIIMVLDADGIITLLNDSGHRILGYAPPELIGKNWFEIRMPEEIRPELEAYFQMLKSRSADEIAIHEDELINTLGERKTIRWRNAILRDDGGCFIGMISSGEDVTERKRAELALRESEERLEFALEGSNLGEWDWNLQTNTIQRNEQWARMLGYTPAELEGTLQQGIDLQHPDDRERSWKAIQDHLQGRTEYYDALYRMRAKNGNYRWIHDRGKIMERDRSGKPLRLCGTHADITDQKQAEERIRALLVEKELILKEVHHRIKNNMNTMMSLLSLQAASATDPYAREALEDAGKRMQAMALLYEELYLSPDFGRTEIGGYLSVLVDQIISNFPNSPMVSVTKQFDNLVLDARQLQPLGIIINELLTNTMKYAFVGRNHGQITMSLTRSEGFIVVSVKDDGIGLPEAFSLERSKGFGLQLVQGLMQQLRGTMRIDSDGGTVIVLKFKA